MNSPFPFNFIYLMLDIMSAAWNKLGLIVIGGISFTQIILSFIILTLVLSAFFGGKNRV